VGVEGGTEVVVGHIVMVDRVRVVDGRMVVDRVSDKA
jgi:hypothetical protein